MSDCPEFDSPRFEACPGCIYQGFDEALDVIEARIQASLDSKPLAKHHHRVANRHLNAALNVIEDLRLDMFEFFVGSD